MLPASDRPSPELADARSTPPVLRTGGEHEQALTLLQNLQRLALMALRRNQAQLRLCLGFACRGHQVRLFLCHGPWGVVIERGMTASDSPYTVAEFAAIDVLNSVAQKFMVCGS